MEYVIDRYAAGSVSLDNYCWHLPSRDTKNCLPYHLASQLTMSQVHRDVIVIGAGWSGLLSCKYMLEERLSVVVLEKRPEIGGVWKYSDDPDILTVMKRTQCTSSSSLTEISDFPMPDEMGEFPRHHQVYQYLNDFCDAFALRPHIRLSCGVIKVEKNADKWEVLGEDGTTYISSKLVVCAGVHQKPNRELENTLLSGFTGEIMHSGTLKSFIPEHKGKRIMIVGGGETAADIVEDWYEGGASQIIWSIPRGQHFFRKYAKILPGRQPQTLDKASSRLLKNLAPYPKGKPGLSWVCHWTTAGSLLAYQGHGIPEWKNDAEFFHFFINKNGHVLDLVDYERVIPKGAIDGTQGKRIYFSDGTQAEVDVIIQCTGYHTEFLFLPPNYQVPLTNNYKFIFNVEDPSLAFIGYVRPIVGSIPLLSEIQLCLASRVFSGAVQLPENGDLVNEANQDAEFWSNYFKDSSKRLSTLVEAYTYFDDLLTKSGRCVDQLELFKDSPRDWLTSMTSPACASCLRLTHKGEERKKALANLRRRGKGCFGPIHLLFIMFCRLIWFDWWLILLGKVKYMFQTNKYCRKMQSCAPVRFINWVWTTPKRWLFDNKTRA